MYRKAIWCNTEILEELNYFIFRDLLVLSLSKKESLYLFMEEYNR